MTGLVSEYLRHARVREASRLASEQIALVDSIGDPALMIGAAFSAVAIKSVCGDMADVLRWSQTAIDWAGGDPVKGSLVVGSPLAAALAFRGAARWWSGRPGWREDLDDATVIARNADPWTLGLVMAWKYGHGISNGVLRGDDAAVRDLDWGAADRRGSERRCRPGHRDMGARSRAVGSGSRRGRSTRTRAAGAGTRHVSASRVPIVRVTDDELVCRTRGS